MKYIMLLSLATLITGCGTTTEQWTNAYADYQENYAQPAPDYGDFPQPMTNQDIEWGVVPNSYSSQNNGSQRYMINTPQGIKYRTCQNLNGGNVYCY